jgi:hypothetical protein
MQMGTKFALIYAKKLKIPATDNSDVLIAAAMHYFCISDDDCSIFVSRNATVYDEVTGNTAALRFIK